MMDLRQSPTSTLSLLEASKSIFLEMAAQSNVIQLETNEISLQSKQELFCYKILVIT